MLCQSKIRSRLGSYPKNLKMPLRDLMPFLVGVSPDDVAGRSSNITTFSGSVGMTSRLEP